MEYQFVKVEVRDQIASIEMDRKRELNALSSGMIKEIHRFSPRSLTKLLMSGSSSLRAGMNAFLQALI